MQYVYMAWILFHDNLELFDLYNVFTFSRLKNDEICEKWGNEIIFYEYHNYVTDMIILIYKSILEQMRIRNQESGNLYLQHNKTKQKT